MVLLIILMLISEESDTYTHVRTKLNQFYKDWKSVISQISRRDEDILVT